MSLNFTDIKKMNKWLFIIILMLFGVVLIMIQSASFFESFRGDGLSPYHYFIKQFASIIIGLVAFLVICMIPLNFYSKIKNLIAVIGILLLIYVVLNGHIANGASSWINLGFFSLQPSEIIKPIMILYIACYFLEKKGKITEITIYFFPFLVVGLCVLLIMLQPDLGTAIIVSGIAGSLLFLAPVDKKYKKNIAIVVASLLVLLLILSLTTNFSLLKEHQKQRFNFISPCSRYQEDSGYQVCNGYIAMNNGGIFGAGIGKSTQKYMYLPFGYTDFIFAIIVEELGVIMSMIIIFVILALIFMIYKIGKKTTDIRGRLICYGVAIYILMHMIVNLGGVTGLLPLTGVPLPFLSYGGSYVLGMFISLGLVQRAYIETKINKKIKKQK